MPTVVGRTLATGWRTHVRQAKVAGAWVRGRVGAWALGSVGAAHEDLYVYICIDIHNIYLSICAQLFLQCHAPK